MKLYVIRHGQSEANAKGFHSGQLQVPLTERGEADARRAGELISGIAYTLKTLNPKIKVYGVEAAGAASMKTAHG